MKFLDKIAILSFFIGIYALYIALENLKENEEQADDLEDILKYLEIHLQSQDELFSDLSNHLEKQDKILERK